LCRDKCSITSALLNQEVGSGQHSITNNLFGKSLEVRPVPLNYWRSLGNDAGDYLISFAKLYDLSGAEPALQAAGVAKLSHVDRWHGYNVTHSVSHCQESSEGCVPTLGLGVSPKLDSRGGCPYTSRGNIRRVATAKNNPNLNYSPDRLVSAAAVEDDSSFELKLRPQRLGEFIGQAKVKENLAVAIEAAKSRGEAMDHVLLYGPPGLGKTTLANIIANELGVHFQPTAAPLLQIKGDLTAIITNMREKQVLFIDEIHRLQPVLEELLYSALEDYKLDIIIGQGPSARTHTLEVKPFTFVGATTRAGLISAPLRSRFGIVLRLEFYTPEDLRVIVGRSAEILGVQIDDAGATEIASRSRGTPRIANRLLRRVRDYAQVRGAGKIDLPTAQASLQMLEVDQYGFDEVDRKLLLTIIEKYQGGPVGLSTLAAVLAEEPDAIEEIYEPFLMQIGFLNRTPRGRVATQLAYEYFKITPSRRQSSLF
jgi:holliday junction DNA helicase RuvB